MTLIIFAKSMTALGGRVSKRVLNSSYIIMAKNFARLVPLMSSRILSVRRAEMHFRPIEIHVCGNGRSRSI